jgi:hypothetical protein
VALLCAAGAAVALVPSIPAAWAQLQDGSQAIQEATTFNAIVHGGAISADQRLHIRSWSTERRVARDIDAMRMRRGSVLLDTQNGFAIVVATKHLDRFVITSDRDFERTLANPVAFHVEYLLVSKVETGTFDRLEAAYPGLYESGAGIATLVQEWPMTGDGFAWRLYRLLPNAKVGVG